MARTINFNDTEYVQIITSLTEGLERCDLQTWNNIQKDIWLKLVKDHIVNYNDMQMFFKMGEVFSDYFEDYHKAIPYLELVQRIQY
jgi:hypothetical protein